MRCYHLKKFVHIILSVLIVAFIYIGLYSICFFGSRALTTYAITQNIAKAPASYLDAGDIIDDSYAVITCLDDKTVYALNMEDNNFYIVELDEDYTSRTKEDRYKLCYNPETAIHVKTAVRVNDVSEINLKMEGCFNMTKVFCNYCGKEITKDDQRVRMLISVRPHSALPTCDKDVDFHLACINKAFGDGFAEDIEEEYNAKKAAKNKKKEETN